MNKEPSRYPQKVSEECWFYENKKSLHVFVEKREGDVLLAVLNVRIPRAKILRSAHRLGWFK